MVVVKGADLHEHLVEQDCKAEVVVVEPVEVAVEPVEVVAEHNYWLQEELWILEFGHWHCTIHVRAVPKWDWFGSNPQKRKQARLHHW